MDATEQKPDDETRVPFVFPKWVNAVPIASQLVLGAVGSVALFSLYFWGAPTHWYVGYTPKQPVPYSHKLHAGDLGIDCRYCHTGAEKSPVAMVPPAETCMNCHAVVFKDSPRIALVKESFEKGTPIEWVRVHKVADFAYFDHSRHLNKGVGCVTCHGRIDQQEVVQVSEPLSMSWCLDCHRNPGPNLRPKDQVANMVWEPRSRTAGEQLAQQYHVKAPIASCSGCHR